MFTICKYRDSPANAQHKRRQSGHTQEQTEQKVFAPALRRPLHADRSTANTMKEKHVMTLDTLDALEKVYAKLSALSVLMCSLDGLDRHVRDGLAFFLGDISDEVKKIVESE